MEKVLAEVIQELRQLGANVDKLPEPVRAETKERLDCLQSAEGGDFLGIVSELLCTGRKHQAVLNA